MTEGHGLHAWRFRSDAVFGGLSRFWERVTSSSGDCCYDPAGRRGTGIQLRFRAGDVLHCAGDDVPLL